MNNIGVYLIELNGKRYIGSAATSFKKRWQNHLSALRKGTHRNRYLQNAFNKYGEEVLKFSILEVIETPEEVIAAEQRYIDELKPEYNLCPIAGNCLGVVRTAEFKQKCATRLAGAKLSEETKRKISEAHIGLKHSEETRKKLSEGMAGVKTRLGCKNSEKTRRAISKANIGKHQMSKEHKQVLLMANKGRKCTEEHKRAVSKAHKGKTVSEETRKKQSEAHIGKKWSLHSKNIYIQCACGCGCSFNKYDIYGRERRFISGHNPHRSIIINPELLLKERENGVKIKDICLKYGISNPTYYKNIYEHERTGV